MEGANPEKQVHEAITVQDSFKSKHKQNHDLKSPYGAANRTNMNQSPQVHLQHLPTKEQNIFYILVLIGSSLLNLSVISLINKDTHHTGETYRYLFPHLHHVFGISELLLGAVLTLMGINIAQALLRHHRRNRKTLLIFGIFSALYLAINLLTISYGIYVFKIQSYWLLIISIIVYISVNTTFVFWYWFVDYPTQIRRLHHPETDCEIEFPAHAKPNRNWLPDFFDYLYFTITTSNTLGAPENHSPSGRRAKGLLILHSLTMMILLVIFVSRAINTLN